MGTTKHDLLLMYFKGTEPSRGIGAGGASTSPTPG